MPFGGIPGLEAVDRIVSEAVQNVYSTLNKESDKAFHVRDITNKIRTQYLSYVEHGAKYATLVGHVAPVQVEDIFVEPQLTKEPDDLLVDTRRSVLGAINAFAIAEKRVLIMGPPGSGKSTLAKYFCLRGCKRVPRAVTIVDGRLPFFVATKDIPKDTPFVPNFDFRRACDGSKKISPDTYLDRITRETGQKPVSFLEFLMAEQLTRMEVKYPFAFVEHLLKKGAVCLLVDGLDEGTDETRQLILDSLSHLAAGYPKNNVVAFSRPKAVPDGIYGFDGYYVVPFDRPRWEKFVDLWFSKKQAAGTELKGVINCNPYFEDLCGNPLLTSILCILMERGYRIPKKRADLYKACIDALMSDLDRSKRLRRLSRYDYITERKRLDVLATIAFQMQRRSKQRARLREIEEYVKDIAFVRPLIKKEGMTGLLDVLELEHGILVEWSNGEYAFPHRTFQEFLSAWHIERSRKEKWFVGALRNELKNRLEEWREIAVILAHLLYDPSDYIRDMVDFAFDYRFKRSVVEEILVQDISCDNKTFEYARNRLDLK
jgi:hypothetical protein